MGYPEAGELAVINRLAFTIAVTDLVWLSSMLFLSPIGQAWLTRPLRTAAPVVDAGGAH